MEMPASPRADPVADGRRAQLLLALLLAAILPMLLLTVPIQTHAVKIDLPRLPDASLPAAAPRFHRLSSTFIPVEPRHPGRFRTLALTPGDALLLDGEPVDLAELRRRLDILSVSGDDWVDFRPDAHARYETFFEVIALVRRAGFEPRLRLDSRSFRDALDESDSAYRRI